MVCFTYNKNNKLVETIHYMPFDQENGLGMTEEELINNGYILADLPEEPQLEGRYYPVLKYNDELNELYYDAELAPKSQEELFQELIDSVHLLVELQADTIGGAIQ